MDQKILITALLKRVVIKENSVKVMDKWNFP